MKETKTNNIELSTFREDVKSQFKDVKSEFKIIRSKFGSEFNQVYRRFDNMDLKFDRLITEMDRKFDLQSADIARNHEKVMGALDGITFLLRQKEVIDNHEVRITQVEQEVTVLKVAVKEIQKV